VTRTPYEADLHARIAALREELRAERHRRRTESQPTRRGYVVISGGLHEQLRSESARTGLSVAKVADRAINAALDAATKPRD
jgi:hypothetical protein